MTTSPPRLDQSGVVASNTDNGRDTLQSNRKKDAGATGSEGETPRHPNSDDSISAYIHATSSPLEGQTKARSSDGRSVSSIDSLADVRAGRIASSPLAPRDVNAAATMASRDATPLLRTPRRPEEAFGEDDDVAAASGMLSLRASQSTPSGLSGSMARLPWTDTFASPKAHQRIAGASQFVVHCDDERETNEESTARAFRLLRDGAQHDAVLFTNGLSQPSLAFSQPEPAQLQSPNWQASSSHANDQEEEEEEEAARDAVIDQAETSTDTTRVDTTADASQASETTLPLDHQGPDGEDASGKKRRRRTKKEEADVLAAIYVKTAFPDSVTRQRLADQLGMTTRAVSIWFQNRRQAERKRASRFGSSEGAAVLSPSAATSAHPRSVSDNVTSIIAAAAAAAPDSKVQRWPPSLDDVASAQRKSPESDDGRAQLASSLAKSTARSDSLVPMSPPTTDEETEEDKENRPVVASLQISDAPAAPLAKGKPRQVLRDIRDLVFGNDSLPPISPPDSCHEDEQPDVGSYAKVTANASTSPSDRPRTLGRSVSANGVQSSRPSMDQVITRSSSTTAIEKAYRRHVHSSARRFKSLCTSKGGRACIDGVLSPPRKRPFIKSLSMSTCLPPVLARLISTHNDDQPRQQKTCEVEDLASLEEAAQRDRNSREILAKMTSSSSGTSSDVRQDTSTVDLLEEDEERTLRLAANRRLAKAQAKGEECFPPKSNALSDMTARPWARSVSGPASQGRRSMPSLDMAASRDRSKPNPHTLIPRLPFAHVSRHGTPSSAGVAAAPDKALAQRTASVENKVHKRKSGDENELRSHANKKKGRRSSRVETSTEVPREDQENIAPTEHRESISDANGLSTFGTPRSGLVNKRAFGRSVSAQSASAHDVHQTPLTRAVAHPSLLYASTPLPSSMASRHQHQGAPASLGSRSGTMNAPSLSADAGSGGREMTPRSLAFTLGLTHAGGYGGGGQTPYGAALQTPFGGGSAGSSIYASRYLPSSSRDIRGSQSNSNKVTQRPASTWSPIGKGGNEASMLGATPSLRGDKRRGAEGGKDAKENNFRSAEGASQRVPFAKIKSQPTRPPPPTFNAAALASEKSRGALPSLASLSSEDASDASMAAPALRRSSRSSPRKGSSALPPQTPTTSAYRNKAPAWSNADDSGFVDGDAELDELIEEEGGMTMESKASKGAGFRGRALGGVESPTKVQQRQRQEDAAQVLLGLAGEGR
ncbi:hypothetical protein BCV69DRAFT_313320 [Microstroma glucosiphilum]|uniref:Homeobox domain-containing protein n=1 Tax=Pseudomicrostroma glucosiphilum TaxID=1684307 RepID=A0A316UAR2_9BASI|nr:hypothetical protein BCV69DRAFT_313320 [Pseudomicrostroma glucosiphilum]PWN20125.1 hypothetical protein BCV69DRAFT_313320 [Pseudomicrostroma glucosiphilum]